MSFNIFTMKSLLSWALKAQAPRNSLRPVQSCRLFSEFSGGAAEEAHEVEEFTTDKKAASKQIPMEKSINEVRLLGRVGKDPAIFEGKKKSFVLFPLATSSLNWDNETGQYNEITEWHTVVNYNPQKIETISRYLRKGDRVYISGKLIYRTGSTGTEKTSKILLNDFISMYS